MEGNRLLKFTTRCLSFVLAKPVPVFCLYMLMRGQIAGNGKFFQLAYYIIDVMHRYMLHLSDVFTQCREMQNTKLNYAKHCLHCDVILHMYCVCVKLGIRYTVLYWKAFTSSLSLYILH